ncbi:MAG TPA: hypothetical protein VLE49_09830, partial [Anaerolineales bacterium]|nr:hypothetical protein [Anaerolineales bacterium]
AVRARLAGETCPPEAIQEILKAVDAPTHWSQLEPPVRESKARFAFMHASLMRKRLTLGDVLIFINWDRESLWDQIWKAYA